MSVSDFDVVFGQAINFNGSVTISSTGATFLPGKPISASITASTPGQPAMSATLQFSGGKVSDVIFSVPGTFSVSLSSYVTFTGTGITLDTSAGPTQPIVTIDSIGVKVALGSFALTGSATDFEFLGNGSFVPLPGFGVVLSVGSATGSSFMWPSWLPIQITELGIQWPDGVETDPTDMLITLSANITGIQGLAGLTFSGSVEGVQIDTGLLLAGQFPIVGISSFGVSVTGNMFGGQIDASLLGGIVKLDKNGNMIASTDTTTPVAARVFYAGLQGGFSFGGLSGFTIQIGLSSLGPLGVQLSVDLPEGILLDPDTGLSLNDFTAGVKFFSTLPSITDPMQLSGPAFAVQSVPVVSSWLQSLQAQVVAQYQAIQQNPNLGGFLAAFTQPMTIIGSADIYSIYTSQQLFNGLVTVEISTDGKFMVAGQLNFADNKLSISGKLYADLSKVASGDVTVLFLANIPDQVQLLTLDGSLKMGFENAQGQQVTFQTTTPALPVPSAQLVGPINNGSVGVGTLDGEGYVDVTFPSSPYPTGSTTSFSGSLNASSVTITTPAIEITKPTSSNVILDSSQAPLEISPYKYRYWLTGVTANSEAGGSAAITASDITFIQGTVSYTDSNGNVIFNQYGVDTSTTNPNPTALPENPTTISLVHGAYVDVRVYPSVGGQLGTSNLAAIVGLGGIAITVTTPAGSGLTPTGPSLLADDMTMRYYLPADTSYAAGEYSVAVLPNLWGDSLSASPDNLGNTYTFSVANVTAQVVGPFVVSTPSGGSTDVGAANAATFTDPTGYTEAGETLPYIDVGFNPAPGAQLDYDSILGTVDTATNTRTFPTSAPFTVDFTPAGSTTAQALTVDPEPIPITLVPSATGATATAVTGTLTDNLPDDGTLVGDQVDDFRYLITSSFSYTPGTLVVTFTRVHGKIRRTTPASKVVRRS